MFCPNLLHLALHGTGGTCLRQAQQSVVVGFQVAHIVVATGPHGASRVAAKGGDTGNLRSVYDAPFGLVVVEQSLEVGHEDHTVVGSDDVEVAVVGLVVGCAIVLHERHLRPHRHDKQQERCHVQGTHKARNI